MKKIEDLALISRVLVLNDKRAFDKLVIQYQSSVRRFLLNLTAGDEMLSDDLAQDTFLKAYIHLRQFKGVSRFSTWLFRIAYNQFYNYHRKYKTDIYESLEGEVKEFSVMENNNELVDELQIAMLCLKPEEKATVLLFYMEDLSVEKISEIIEIPPNTVKSHLHRARQKMKKKLIETDYE